MEVRHFIYLSTHPILDLNIHTLVLGWDLHCQSYVCHIWTSKVIFCVTGKNATEMMKQVCSLVSQTSLGEVLGSAPDDDVLYHCYLHDYVKSVHRTYHTNAEVSMQENNVRVMCA